MLHDDGFAPSVRVRDAPRGAFISVDTDQRLRRAAVSASRPDRLTFEPGDVCFFWRDGVGLESWNGHRGLKLVKVTAMLTVVDAFSSNQLEQLSHVTERERLAQEAVRESQDPGRDTDHVSDEPELPRQPSQSSQHEPNVAPVPEQPDVSMPDRESPETLGEPADTSNDDHDEQTTAEPVPHNCSSHLEWRPEHEVPPQEPDDPVATRRRLIAKRPPPTIEQEEFRQRRVRLEPVPELFPLTGDELSEDLFEILIDLFTSPSSEHRQDSRPGSPRVH